MTAAGRSGDELPSSADLQGPGASVHLMGAAGAGMRALAVLLGEAGYRIGGCDLKEGLSVPELERLGAGLRSGHDPSHLEGVDLLVRSSAVPEDHPEVEAARRRGLPVWSRARALAAAVNDHRLAAVAGTHGKTTITAMMALAGIAADLDPSAAVGGPVREWDGLHARAGRGALAVVEADEYDASFLSLDPDLAVVSSVEPEHLDSYGDEASLRRAFSAFAGRAVEREGVLCCADEAGAGALARELGDATSYGFDRGADYRVRPVDADGPEQTARLEGPDGELTFHLGAPGRHNLQNAGGALAAALRLGAEPEALGDALAGFTGVGRRLERLAEDGRLAVVDDYAHHPTEVAASLEAVRGLWPDRRLVAVFQPHLFSRTERFAAEFGRALSAADAALVLPIFPAREEPIPGVTSDLIVEAARAEATGPRPTDGEEGLRLAETDEALEAVRRAPGPTVFLFMGAGDVTETARRAADEVRDRAVGG